MCTEINVEDKISDEMIIEKVDTVVNKEKNIMKLLKNNKEYQSNCLIVRKKLIGIKSVLNISELEFEYYEKKEKLYRDLDNILRSEEIIINELSLDEPNNDNIKSEFNNIKLNIDEIEKAMYAYVNYLLLVGKNYNIKDHIKSYKQKLTCEINNISTVCDEKLKEISEQIKLKESELSELTLKKEELSQQISTLENMLVEKEKDITTKFNDLNNKNDQMSQETENQINQIKNNALDSYSAIEKNIKEKYNELEQQTKDKFDILEKEIEAKDTEISNLIGLIGNKANIGEYKSNADNAHAERVKWQIATVIIFGVAFAMMFFITILTKNYNITTVVKYIVSVILLGMSGYTAKQASNLRKDEVYYRKQQLELSSIDVYLDDMPYTLKEKIKENLSNKMFGQARETYQNKYDEETNNILENILKILKKLIK